MNNAISEIDIKHLDVIRNGVKTFLNEKAALYDKKGRLLDVAPQKYLGAKEFFKKIQVETLDIDPQSNASYIADLCCKNDDIIDSNYFDIIVCTEVLEHTLNPFNAILEIHRILKNNGILLLTVPFNFRIHGPLPDCWRFTEHGLKELLKIFQQFEIHQIDTDNRWLMPIQYHVVAIK